MNLLIKDTLILPMDSVERSPKYFRGSVGIVGNRIAFVGSESEQLERFEAEHADGLKVIDGRGKMLMPGLINVHNHVSMSLMRSYADDIPLMPWLNDYIWPFETKLTREDVKTGAELGIAEMLLGGTTAFVDMYWMQEAVGEAVEQTGIRAVLSPTFTDAHYEAFERDCKSVIDRYADGQCSRITLMIAPHAPYSCSADHLLRAKAICDKYGIGLNIHVAETVDESVLIRERYGMTPIEFVNDLGLLDSKSLAVHSVHLNDSDIEILRKSGASAVHNPQSNMKIASGVSPVVAMLKRGINVAIGTDGPCSNNDLDMWDEMRSASFLQKLSSNDPCAVPAYDILYMATVGGAKAIGMAGKLGQIKEGMLADIIMLNIEKPHLYPRHDMVANLVYCVKSGDVDTVIVDGEILVEDCKLLRTDVGALCCRAQECVESILQR